MGLPKEPIKEFITDEPIKQEIIVVKKKNKSIKCYCLCNNTKDKYCINNLSDYITSPFFETQFYSKHDNDKDPCCDICMTCIFCIPKQALCFPFLFGAIINTCINYCKKTDKNYLC